MKDELKETTDVVNESISEEIAIQDMERWLKSKRISAKKREANEDAEKIIIGGIQDGRLIVNENNTITMKLIWPTGENGNGVNTMTFKNRITVSDRNQANKGVKAGDGDGRVQGTIAVLTDQPIGVIKKLDAGEDYETASAIAVYFL